MHLAEQSGEELRLNAKGAHGAALREILVKRNLRTQGDRKVQMNYSTMGAK